MKINRENCEAWFLDYYEGNLSKEGTEELFAFLIVNPDMRELFDSYEEVSFAPEDHVQFEGKTELKKTVEETAGINDSNYEEYFVGAVEDVLDAEEQAQLEKFLVQHPSKREELELLRKTILQPETEIVFEHKAGLKKSPLVTETNFEEMAVAALEGELPEEALTAFHAFLAAHPVLKADFELLAQTKLQPDAGIVFEGKEALKKKALVITAGNFEETAIASVEGLLNSEEQKTFAAAVSGNEAFKKTAALYAQTKLQADTTIVFENKEALKQKERAAFWWMLDIRFAAAAAVALLLGIFFWNYSGRTPGKEIAGVDTATKTKNAPLVPSSKDQLANNGSADSAVQAVPAVDNLNAHPVQKNQLANAVIQPKNKFVPVPPVNTKEAPQSLAMNGTLPMLNTSYYPQVDFSDAYYNSENFGSTSASTASQALSPGQYAMRWMKKQLDRPSKEEDKDDAAVYTAMAQNKNNSNGDVTGFDLTSSAVNRIGEATGSNLHLGRESEGTILTVGKYRVLLNHKH